MPPQLFGLWAPAEIVDRARAEWAKKWAMRCPYSVGAERSSSNTMSPGTRPTSEPSGILIHPLQLFDHSKHRLKCGGLLCPFRGGRTGSPFNTVAWAEAYRSANWHLDPSSRLVTIHMGRKLAGCCAPLGEVELGPI